MKNRYFMDPDAYGEGTVMQLKDWLTELNDECSGLYGADSLRLELCKREIGGEMWCKEEGEFVERGEYGDCGKQCPNYNPCNGHSGRCRNLTNGFVGVDEFYILWTGGKLEKEEVNARRKKTNNMRSNKEDMPAPRL
jgi:hypothetical protein